MNYKKIFSYVGLLLALLISAECPDNGVENIASNGGSSSEDTDDEDDNERNSKDDVSLVDIDDVDLSKDYGYGYFTF